MGKAWQAIIAVGLVGAFFSLVGLVGYLLYGPGITITIPDFFGARKATTTEEVVMVDPLAEEPGTLFECAGDKALKAEFLDRRVRLALSDGRVLTLPQTVSDGEIRYANADGSFAFRNIEHTVFVEENGAATYANCTAAVGN